MKRIRKNYAGAIAVALAVGSSLLVAGAAPASASVSKLYAYVNGGAFAPASCPKATTVSKECTLGEALVLAPSGSEVLLATPATTGHYYGNFTLSSSVTLAPAAGVADPTIDGDGTGSVDCPTTICDGPVVTVPASVRGVPVDATFKALTIQDGYNQNNPEGGGGGIEVGGTVDLEGVTITDSNSTDPEGAGGIFVASTGTLTVTDSTVSLDNGGIYNNGSVSISGSTFSKDLDGGAIDNLSGMTIADSTFLSDGPLGPGQSDGAISNAGTLLIEESTFSSDAGWYGAGVFNSGAVSIAESTFSDNRAGSSGGAIDSSGTLTVASSTFSGNVAGGGNNEAGEPAGGGAIYSSGSFAVTSSTFTGNTGTGTIYNLGGAEQPPTILGSTFDGNNGAATLVDDGSSMIVAGTILADQTTNDPAAPDTTCSGGVNDAGFNLEDDVAASCGFSAANHDLVGVDPELGPLQDNGGPTETMEPAADSPVLGQIPAPTTLTTNPGGAPIGFVKAALCPIKDQRGDAAPGGTWGCAIGAVDLANTAETLVTSVSPYYGPDYGGTTVTIKGANLAGATGVTFAGVSGTSLTVISATKITVVAPVGRSQSIADVVVTAPGGLSPWRPTTQFIYD